MNANNKAGAPQAERIADDIWIMDGPLVRFYTMPFPTRMVIVRLRNSSLLIHSPIELTPAVREAVENLGAPRYLVSPNVLHHLFWGQWQQTYREALSFSPPGLQNKRPDLVFDGELGDQPDTAWADEVDQFVFKGSRILDEVVFFHRASATLVLGDLVENFDPAWLSWPHRQLARVGGVLAPQGQTPLDYRLSFIRRRREARQSVRKLLAWQPQTVVMCHGLPVHNGAQAFLEAAFAWAGDHR